MTIRSKLLLAFIPILFSLIIVVLIGYSSLISMHQVLIDLFHHELLTSKQIGYAHLHLIKLEDALSNLLSARRPDERTFAAGQLESELGQVQAYLDKIDQEALSANEQALLLQFDDQWERLAF